jgi:hypothetical protein
MPKPPKSTPHSDIDGVHQDERRNTDVASDLGQSAGVVGRAKEKATARPPVSNAKPSGPRPR